MDNLAKKAGYIKGLLEGLKFSDPGQEKLMQAIVDLLGELSDRVMAAEDMMDELNDYVESIDDDLSDLESEHAGDFSLLDDDDFDEDYLEDMDSAKHRLHLIGGGERDGKDDGEESDDEDEDGGEFLTLDDEDEEDSFEDEEDVQCAVICPDCHEPFFVDITDDDDAKYACPHCGHTVTPKFIDLDSTPFAHPIDD